MKNQIFILNFNIVGVYYFLSFTNKLNSTELENIIIDFDANEKFEKKMEMIDNLKFDIEVCKVGN